jgi:hypothetical protein
VDTDWSQEHRAIGAVLSQQQEGHERVIAYGAKKLSKSQANYPATKGELFAVIYFLNHWRYYLKWKWFLAEDRPPSTTVDPHDGGAIGHGRQMAAHAGRLRL